MKKRLKKYKTTGPVDPTSLGTGKLVELAGKAKEWLKSKMTENGNRKININTKPAPKSPTSNVNRASKGGSTRKKK